LILGGDRSFYRKEVIFNDFLLCSTHASVICVVTHTVPPSFGTSGTVQETDVTVVVNSTLILECSVQAIPPPDITWYKNGEEFVLNEDRMTLKKVKTNMFEQHLFSICRILLLHNYYAALLDICYIILL